MNGASVCGTAASRSSFFFFATPAPSQFLASLSPFHPPPSSRLSEQWSATLSNQYRPPVSTGDSITVGLNISEKWRNDKNKMSGFYLQSRPTKSAPRTFTSQPTSNEPCKPTCIASAASPAATTAA